jgi:acyl carrier protein
MQLEQVESDLIQFLITSILANEVELDTHMELKSIGIDSFSIVEIILFIERKYGVVLRDDQLLPAHFKSINSIAQLILSEA